MDFSSETNERRSGILQYTIKPDQICTMRSLVLLILIPIFNTAVYSTLRRLGIRRPLQRMAIGGILMAIAFILAANVQFQIEAAPANTVHILWQLPQNFVGTISDIMFHIIGNKVDYFTQTALYIWQRMFY